MTLYLAFPAYNIVAPPGDSVQPSSFPAGNSRGKYIPLKRDALAAIAAALEADCNVLVAAKAATEETMWWVLVWTLNSVDLIGEAWLTGLLHWSSNMRGVQWWGALDNNSVGQKHWELTWKGAIGFEGWCDMALTQRCYRKRNDAGTCHGCSASNVPVWAAKFNKAQFCGQCWLDFLLSKPWSRERVEPDPGRQLVFKWKSSPDSCTDESWSDYDTDTQNLLRTVSYTHLTLPTTNSV